ncbi:MAG: hemolysin family protein [Bacteroidales bacterium]|jgi:CBS domain containing-hemolysin-like protein|nr:hemolysin family protein [Bacteroidales bacterium]
MNPFVIIPFSVLLAAFFSAMELSFIASNKLRIELDRKQGQFGSGIIFAFTRNPGLYISTMLIGVNIATVIFSMLTADLIEAWLLNRIPSEVLIFIIQTVITTFIILIFADFLPKSVVRISPNFFLNIFAIPTAIFYYLFYPVSKFTLWLANLIMRLFFGIKAERKEQENRIFTRIDLDHFVNDLVETEEEKREENSSLRIFQNALDFSSVKARECMVPRTEIVALPIQSSPDELRQQFIESGHSKILLYRDNIDNMVGYYELKDILHGPEDIAAAMRKLPVVPETMTANRVLRLLSDAKKSIALVVDEFGGTAGVITIEDVLEEIVGDIEDEHDTSDLVEKKINDREYILSGRLDIDYLNEEYDLGLPESDEYTTLAGLILFAHGNIPRQQEKIRVGPNLFTVLKSSSTKVELLKLQID